MTLLKKAEVLSEIRSVLWGEHVQNRFKEYRDQLTEKQQKEMLSKIANREFPQIKKQIIENQKQLYFDVYIIPVLGATYHICLNCIKSQPYDYLSHWCKVKKEIQRALTKHFKGNPIEINYTCRKFIKEKGGVYYQHPHQYDEYY